MVDTKPVSKTQSFLQWAGLVLTLLAISLRVESRMATIEADHKWLLQTTSETNVRIKEVSQKLDDAREKLDREEMQRNLLEEKQKAEKKDERKWRK